MAADYIPYSGPIVTRAEAKAAGLMRYFLDRPCIRGHLAERFTSCAVCLVCNNEKSLRLRSEKRDEINERRRAWYDKNRSAHTGSERAAAKASGAKLYFTGRPCPNGHSTERYTASAKCVECIRLRDQRRERDPQKERIRKRENSKQHRERNRERRNEQQRQYRAANPEKGRARAREYQSRFTREEKRERNKAWLAANPFRGRMYRQKRRARKREADGFYTTEDIDRIRKAQRDKCAICRIGLKQNGYVDHITALAKGGSNWPRNLQLLCLHCNSRKSSRDQIDFVRDLGLLI